MSSTLANSDLSSGDSFKHSSWSALCTLWMNLDCKEPSLMAKRKLFNAAAVSCEASPKKITDLENVIVEIQGSTRELI